MKSTHLSNYENEHDLLDVYFQEFKSGNKYYAIIFNCSLIHSVKSKKSHTKKLNELIEKYDLKKIEL